MEKCPQKLILLVFVSLLLLDYHHQANAINATNNNAINVNCSNRITTTHTITMTTTGTSSSTAPAAAATPAAAAAPAAFT